ncbi:Retrovirus-related Pol polyprotein from transposon RE2 [Cardamine amara subsp. amara]|uniref:Retrovirus-related Pol polyprotein from transposon RE2 n=1 Tax=Cardamine amara subsp. amara TaxID=228776 RepID=A0ABD1ARL5_CARAN
MAAVTDTDNTYSQGALHINMTNITKLNTTNFLMWSKQIHALLDGYDLAGYLDRSKPAPSPTVTTGGLV